MEEIWKDIEGYENIYQISNLGEVKSLSRQRKSKSYYTTKEKILKTRTNTFGYCIVNLHKNKKIKTTQIHTLVALAFISNPNNYPIVNHKDENPLNNRVDNLEWCTRKYNANYGSAIERKIKSTNYIELSQKKFKEVSQYALDGTFIKTWGSIKEAADHYNICQSNISKVCNGQYKQSCNYIWKIVKEGE